MYASEMREQNDISLIIGHLPKRLQEKIMPNWVHRQKEVLLNGMKSRKLHSEGLKQPRDSGVNPIDEVISINYFLPTPLQLPMNGVQQFNAKPVSESHGMTFSPQQEYENNAENDENIDKNTVVIVPGVLYVNNFNSSTLKNNEVQSTSVNKVLSVKKKNGKLNIHDDMVNSPYKQFASIDKPLWINDINDSYVAIILKLLDNMIKMMSKDKIIQNWEKFCCVRTELRKVFLELLMTHTKLCCEKKIDNFFWKVLYYNIREYLRQQQQQQQYATENIQHYIISIIEDGLEFYQNLYEQLRTTYLTEQPNANYLLREKSILVAKVISQRALISLGDLWRYKTKEIKSQDYTKAMKYYEQAQAILPANGIPYNQLALISIHYRQKFDAIYYYVRCLMSSSAVQSARENLIILFDEIRKKHKGTAFPAPQMQKPDKPKTSKASKCARKEIWIYPDGERHLHRTNDDDNYNNNVDFEEENLKKIPPKELSRYFTFSYTYIVGMLYTGIGMETIQETQRTLLLQLKVLLNHHIVALSRFKLLKIIALNIFVLESSLSIDTRRQYALNFCNQMFGHILQKANGLLKDLNNDISESGDNKSFLNLIPLLQFIRIYMMWLSTHVNVWKPGQPKENSTTTAPAAATINCWKELQRFFQLIKQSNFNLVAHDDVVFEEDIFLAGFAPLSAHLSSKHSHMASDETLQFNTRIISVLQFEEFFSKIKEDLQSSDYISRATEEYNTNIEMVKQEPLSVSKEESKIIVNNSWAYNDRNDLQEELSQLTKLKKNLEARSNAKQVHSKKLREILNGANKKIYVEVRPKYLLPDTNCFIDCLEDFESIIKKYKHYTLIIPLTVVRELYGLSKGVKFDHTKYSRRKERIYHYDDVSSRAKKALDFIMASKNNIKCSTTKGSIINASLFLLAEEENVCNDDKILATAVALSRSMSFENNSTEDGKCVIQTELVLITTDRNLRVKALSRNLIVSELSEFLHWAENYKKQLCQNGID